MIVLLIFTEIPNKKSSLDSRCVSIFWEGALWPFRVLSVWQTIVYKC